MNTTVLEGYMLTVPSCDRSGNRTGIMARPGNLMNRVFTNHIFTIIVSY